MAGITAGEGIPEGRIPPARKQVPQTKFLWIDHHFRQHFSTATLSLGHDLSMSTRDLVRRTSRHEFRNLIPIITARLCSPSRREAWHWTIVSVCFVVELWVRFAVEVRFAAERSS